MRMLNIDGYLKEILSDFTARVAEATVQLFVLLRVLLQFVTFVLRVDSVITTSGLLESFFIQSVNGL